jgi:hypothetical protein
MPVKPSSPPVTSFHLKATPHTSMAKASVSMAK